MDILYIYYFGFINILTAVIFTWDKIKASFESQNRISEVTFHILEALGGCFSTFLFINLLNHKKAKFRYKFISYSILCIWIYLLWNYRQIWFY